MTNEDVPAERICTSADLFLCDQHAVLRETRVSHQLHLLANAPEVTMETARKLVKTYGFVGEFVTMKVSLQASETMQEYLRRELLVGRSFVDYEVCDVGFWDLDVSSDVGFTWHNDHNWNSFLCPENRSYHGWFVNSASDDCNSTLAVSLDARFNECNTNTVLGITDVRDDERIKPDVVVPLVRGQLILFPYGAVHRTHRFKPPEKLVGHRLCTSFVLHHKEDGLNDAKLATLSDEEICRWFSRYIVEKACETDHYMVRLLEAHPRTGPLMKALLDAVT